MVLLHCSVGTFNLNYLLHYEYFFPLCCLLSATLYVFHLCPFLYKFVFLSCDSLQHGLYSACADVAQPAVYPVPILFPALHTSFLPVSDGMTDQGNRLSYILINPSPDTRLELHDVV